MLQDMRACSPIHELSSASGICDHTEPLRHIISGDRVIEIARALAALRSTRTPKMSRYYERKSHSVGRDRLALSLSIECISLYIKLHFVLQIEGNVKLHFVL